MGIPVALAPPSVHTSSVPEGWLTVTEAAERKNLDPQIIRNALNRGTLPGEKVGDIWLIRIEDVDRWNPKPRGRPRIKQRGRPRKQ